MLKSKIQHKEVTKMNCHKMRVYIFIIQRKRIYQDNNYREVKVLNQYTMIKNQNKMQKIVKYRITNLEIEI